MKLFWNVSLYLKKHLMIVIPTTVVLGIILGVLLDLAPLKSLTMLFTILIVFPMMIDLRIQNIFSLDDVKVQLCTQIVNFAMIPFIGYGLANLFLKDQVALALGLLLVALLPTSGGMTIAWTGFAKGNVQAAVKMTVIGLFLGALCAPFYIKLLMGEAIAIPLLKVIQLVALIVVVPLILGQLTKFFLIKKYTDQVFNTEIKPKMPALSVWGLIGLIFIAIALKAKFIIGNPTIIIRISIPLLLFYFINYVLASLIGRAFLSREDAMALVYGTALRSLSLALVMTMTIFGEQGAEIALLVALAYIIQVQSATWYIRLAETIFR